MKVEAVFGKTSILWYSLLAAKRTCLYKAKTILSINKTKILFIARHLKDKIKLIFQEMKKKKIAQN